MLGYLSTNKQEASINHLDSINYLLGNYNVALYMYQSDFWTKVGVGKSKISFNDKLMSEEIEILKGDEVIAINNTIGHDDSDCYKMLNMNMTTGTMEVYKGKLLDEKLVFCNSDSTSNRSNDTSYVFKMIYNQLSKSENQVVIGRSKDEGRTWIPFIKTHYIRK